MVDKLEVDENLITCSNCVVEPENGTFCIGALNARNRYAIWQQPGFATRVFNVTLPAGACLNERTRLNLGPITLIELRGVCKSETMLTEADLKSLLASQEKTAQLLKEGKI